MSESQKLDKSYCPTKDYKYFCHDQEGDGFVYFKCKELRNKFAQDAIEKYLDDGWSEGVADVVCGEITHQSTMTEKTFSIGELNKGVAWWDDWDYVCKYELKPLGYVCPSTLDKSEASEK